jgi:hypothetical protein
MEEMWSDKDRLESYRTSKLRADETGDKTTVAVMEIEGSQFWRIVCEDLEVRIQFSRDWA